MSMPPIKPEVMAKDGALWVFIGADYKVMPFDVADKFVRSAQSELYKLRKQAKVKRRAIRG